MSSESTSPEHEPRIPPWAGEALLARAPRPWMRGVPYVVAVGLAAVLIPATAQILVTDYGVNGGLAVMLGFAQGAPLLLAVIHPLRAWRIVIVADIAGAFVVVQADVAGRQAPWTPVAIVGYLVLCLAVSLRETRRTVLNVWLVTVVASILLSAFRDPVGPDGPDSSVLFVVLSGAVLLLGSLLRERGETRRRLVEQEAISETERARLTLLEERTRIARELHDVVAHHMTVISVQADSAPYRLSGVSDEVREEFESIAAGARESIGEMRRLLQVLRSEDARDERAPQPGLGKLPQLVEATRRGGVPVELSLPGPGLTEGPVKVSPAVGLSAYRIVQEALANVVRHAPGAPTRVSLSTDDGHLTVLVVNGRATKPVPSPEWGGTGHGLVGMGERVRLVGGTLDAGPLPDGGFRVAARLPMTTPGDTPHEGNPSSP